MAVRFSSKLLPVVLFGALAGVCFAPESPPEPALAERGALAQDFLKSRLAVWQDRLELKDWNIELIQSGNRQLRKGTLGNIHWDGPKKTATIRVLAAGDYQMPYRAAIRDMEFTLVHELIHLELASLPRSDASRSDEEHAVNHMTDALLALDRR